MKLLKQICPYDPLFLFIKYIQNPGLWLEGQSVIGGHSPSDRTTGTLRSSSKNTGMSKITDKK